MTVETNANKVKKHLVSHAGVCHVMNVNGRTLSAAFANALTPQHHTLAGFEPFRRSKMLLILRLPFFVLFFALGAIVHLLPGAS